MRVKEFGEADLLVTFFTPRQGKTKGIAKNAKKSKTRFVNCLDIFSLANLEYSPKKKGSLNFIHSGKLVEAFPGLRKNYGTLIKASYMIELTDMLFPWELSDPFMFNLMKDSFKLLAEGEDIEAVPVFFELAAMSLGGYKINLEKCCICGRKYTGNGTAVFKPDKGGIACMKCQQVTKLTPGMSPETVTLISHIQSLFNNFPDICQLHRGFISEIKPILKLHREYHLEGNPKSFEYF